MELVIIAAVAKNNVIGIDGGLPWDLPGDMRRFADLTRYHPVMMGRKTYESIGHPLPNRLNVVLSTQEGYQSEGAYVFNSLEGALESLKKKEPYEDEIIYSKVYVIGGGEVYKQTLPLADMMEITHINSVMEGDVFFPQVICQQWLRQAKETREGYLFCTYKRNKRFEP